MEPQAELSVDEPPFLTVAEAAELLRLAPQTVYKMRSQGRLPAMRIGGRALFSRAALETLMEREGRGLVGR